MLLAGQVVSVNLAILGVDTPCSTVCMSSLLRLKKWHENLAWKSGHKRDDAPGGAMEQRG